MSDADIRRDERFWMALLYGALAGYVAVIAVVSVYIRLTADRPNRGWIALVLLAALLFCGGFYGLRHTIVRMRHRLLYLIGSDILAGAFILVASMLDGGVRSPLAALLVLPFVYLAIGYPLSAVLICGSAIWLGAFALLPATAPPVDYSLFMIELMLLGVSLLMATIGATARDRQNQALQQLRHRLECLATTDDLTGCLNRRAFVGAISKVASDVPGQSRAVALMLIDVDHFKQINDRFGHMAGDAALRRVADVLRRCVREGDIVGRLGGDELAVLASVIEPAAARGLAETLCAAVRAATGAPRLTVSIGVCSACRAVEAAEFYRRADTALYHAKADGRDRVSMWAEAEPAVAAAAATLIGDARVR